MASPEISSALINVESSSSSQQDKASDYRKLLQLITQKPDATRLGANLTAFVDSILGDTLGIVSARPLLNAAVEAISSIPAIESRISTGTHALQTLEPRVVSFEEQDSTIREILADAFQENNDFLEAAKMLQGIQLDSSQRVISDDLKVKTWIRICRLFLEEDDTTNAEIYLNRAKNLVHRVKDDELNLQFQLSQARILDSRRNFIEASQVYHSFSFSPILEEGERLRALSSAIVCAILAPAGPLRSRSLAKLYKDERAPQMEEFSILEKMFLDRLLSPTEVSAFADKLAPHQLAETADGSTVLTKAVIEHNLLAASRLYNNIGVAELGVLLDLEAEKAEEYASRMLEQGRVTGRIDQIDGVIFFDGHEGGPGRSGAGQSNSVVRKELRSWDHKVQGITEEVERVASMLQASHPVRLHSPLNI